MDNSIKGTHIEWDHFKQYFNDLWSPMRASEWGRLWRNSENLILLIIPRQIFLLLLHPRFVTIRYL